MSRTRKENPGKLRYVVGERLRLLRKRRHLTLRDVAVQLGTSGVTVQRLETGQQTLDLDWLEKFAELYKVPVESLVSSKGF